MPKKKTYTTLHTRSLVISLIVLTVAASIGLFFYRQATSVLSDWPSANQNVSNTREASHASMTSANVAKLGLLWSFPIKSVSEWGAATTNPLIIGNVAYFEDLKSNVYAVNLKTGKQIWEKVYNEDIAGPAGVSVDNGRIFSVKGHFEIAALDMQGKELWTTNISNNENVGIDIQTTAQYGLVYVSTVPGVSNSNFYKGGAVGRIFALDQTSGKVVWSFDTVDTADIWGNASVNSGGGAWYPPAIDPLSNTLYWGIGNPAPWPGTKAFPNGASRPGNNLYTNSLVALDASTGNLSWYNQVRPHDLFDYDLQVSPILTTIKVNGAEQAVVIGAGKMGKVYAFNRQTGEKIWESNVGTHLNDTLQTLPKGITKVSPGPLGGVETNMAYSDGMIYVPVVDMEVEYTPAELVTASFDLAKAKGELVALDANSGKIMWQKSFETMNVGAATVVNDLVFTATLDGKIYAFDKKTGDQLWTYQASGGINGWPAVKGDTIIFPVGMGKTPALVAFKIGAGTSNSTPSSTPITGAGKSFGQ